MNVSIRGFVVLMTSWMLLVLGRTLLVRTIVCGLGVVRTGVSSDVTSGMLRSLVRLVNVVLNVV